jgi:DNA-binding beta-propeller fold protein YncE
MTAETPIKKLNSSANSWLDRPVFHFWPSFSIEKLLVILIISLTLISRVYDLGARVMSHDEVNHVVPSFDLYEGRGYRYDPVTHGPFQFHMIAFSYFLFGDSDFSSRLPHALFGVAVVLFALFGWRRYLGRTGALVAGLFFMISPYMLFYSRYARNEIFIVFWGSLMLWTFLRYLEDGRKKWLILLSVITALHYADKATSYIFTAEALIFMAILFIVQVIKPKWKSEYLKTVFLVLAVITILVLSGVFALSLSSPRSAPSTTATTGETQVVADGVSRIPTLVGVSLAVLALVAALVVLALGAGFPLIRSLRSFDLVILQLTLILPLLSAAIIKVIGFDPLDYTQEGMVRSALVIVPMAIISVLGGLLWNRKVWIRCAVIFWSIFIVFYTTFFTQGDGFFVGLLGALGYWMSQQSVQRGTQPLYYYALVQIPIYEFLPAIGTVIALVIGLSRKLFISKPGEPFSPPEEEKSVSLEAEPEIVFEDNPILQQLSEPELPDETETEEELLPPVKKRGIFSDPPDTAGVNQPVPTLILLLFWSLISLIAFSLAGERMPWLTTHIALPLILCASFGVGYLLESTPWEEFSHKKGLLVFLLGILFIFAISAAMGSLLGTNPPFKGKELAQLTATSTFLLAFLATLASAGGLVFLLKEWKVSQILRLLLLSFLLILTAITFRASYRASFINYDYAKEFLVYAHATRDPKDILEQVETISARLYGSKDIPVAYDNDSLYPYWWYFRDYPNRKWYSDTPTKDLRDSPVILVGYDNYAKVEPVVGDDYYQFNYKRMWWPIEDYDNLTWNRFITDLKDPLMRSALWQIWFDRDYTLYAQATGRNNFTLSTWSPAAEMRMYVRKDIAAQIWEYGISPIPQEPKVNPYAAGTISLEADLILGAFDGLTLSGPKAIAVSPDGTLYISDTFNHRILHITSEGKLLHSWGGFADILSGSAPAGMFNHPYGIAVSAEGFVYVADTWNHRIQKFTAGGDFIIMWDTWTYGDVPDGFWGPRGIALDSDGNVYVTDTGKQRVVVFDSNGNYSTQFGGLGMTPGYFDEPVGIAVDNAGLVYVADTWNNRIQVIKPFSDHDNFSPYLSWDVDAWSSQSLENKPFLALNAQNHVLVTDPDWGRILQFDQNGNFLQLWGGFDNATLIGNASGVAVDTEGHVWITDATNNTLLRFSPPEK